MQNTLQTGELRPKRFPLSSFFLRRRNLIIEVVASLYILLFLYTGINKFFAVKDLSIVLKDYPIIGQFPGIVTWSLPTVEIIVALALFFPKTRLWGLYSAFILMSTFTIYLGYMMVFTPKLPCTCGGMLQNLSWPQHLIFNLLFLLLAFAAIRLRQLKWEYKNELR